MKKSRKILVWILVAPVAVVLFALASHIFVTRLASEFYTDSFYLIQPGMTKCQIKKIVGNPKSIDSSDLGHDVWYYEMPPAASESPTCYFDKGDSILVRFDWEDIGVDTSLVTDSTRFEGVLQMVLDSKELQSFFHPTAPGRMILCVTGEKVPAISRLKNSGFYVKVVDSLEECENCLIFESIEITDSTIQIKIQYPIEGVQGNFLFVLSENNWLLTTSELTEE